jgi:predicted  nucleic acid-binding Zn-ribbon protein
VREAIEESDRLQNEIEILQQQQSKAMVEDKEMSKKIEILEDELAVKENTIVDLRNNKTMTLEEVEEELGKIMKVQEEKMDAQTASIDSLTKANLASTKQMDDLGVMFQSLMREFKEKK